MDGEQLLLSLLCLLSLPVVIPTGCPTSPFTDSAGFIISPGFDTAQSYDDNLECTYGIMVSINLRVILEFKKLSILGTMPDCKGDSLEILVGCSNSSIGKFCSCSNLTMPKKIYSLDNCMTLIFKSDGSMRGEGFRAVYTSIDNSTELDPDSNCSSTELLGSTKGTFYTPNWPLTYPPNAACLWRFRPPRSKIVRLFFMSFEMEGKFECDPYRPAITADEIRITGTNSTGEVNIVPRICAKPEKLYYPIKEMQVVRVSFKSNHEEEHSGAIAGYASYNEGTLGSSSEGCEAIEVPKTTGEQTLARALGPIVVASVVLAVAMFW